MSRNSATTKLTLCLLLLAFVLPAFAQNAPPTARVENVADDYFGVKIVDPYRWMEDLKSTEMQKWMRGQADYVNAYLKQLPLRDALLKRIEELGKGAAFQILDVRRRENGTLFYEKQFAADNVSKLYLRDGQTGAEKLLIDPDKFAAGDASKHFTLEYFEPSPDGKKVLYAVAEGGSEQWTLRVLDTETMRDAADVISERVERAYNYPTWLPDGRGFFYARRQKLAANAPPTEIYKNTRAFLHRLGEPVEQDAEVLGIGTSPLVELMPEDFPSVSVSFNSPFLLAQVRHGDSGLMSLYSAPLSSVGSSNIPWKKICGREDKVKGYDVDGADIYLRTAAGAPNFKVIRTSLAAPDFARAAVVFPEGKTAIDYISASKSEIYAGALEGGLDVIYRVDKKTPRPPQELKLPENATGFVISASPRFDEIWLGTSSWTKASGDVSYNPKTGKFTDLNLQPKGAFDHVPGYESREVKVKSFDGTLVPLSIIYKKGIKLDGSSPALLYGYGSYGITQYVGFSPTSLAWLERGGVFAIAHVRGGGEYGEAWHLAGFQQTKPNTWKDFIACAEYLVSEKFTSPAHLAGQGGSAGGILIGRAITDRPDLFAAAIINVGVNDMLRMETTTNGVPNIQEFGSVKTEAGFRALLEMSAFHHVRDGAKYPAVLLTTGINDPRVEPWMSGKMAARLQAASASGKPILLRVDYDAGHGIGSSRKQQDEARADEFAFLLHQLGAANR
jgi:prolyl oligopeptidase